MGVADRADQTRQTTPAAPATNRIARATSTNARPLDRAARGAGVERVTTAGLEIMRGVGGGATEVTGATAAAGAAGATAGVCEGRDGM